MTIATILAFAGSTVGRVAIIGGGILAFVGAFAWQQQNIGARKAVAKIERGERKNVQKATSAGSKSRSSQYRGVLDPYTVSDN